MSLDNVLQKMRAEQVSLPAIQSFTRCYEMLQRSETGLIPETQIEPVANLPRLEEVAQNTAARSSLLRETAILKLNGGLGTSMGLERAKSLLEVRPGVTFLDLIGRQVRHFRQQSREHLRFLLLNSFSTSADTLAWLKNNPDLGAPEEVELLQNKVPKILTESLEPAVASTHPALEWCPPGHGDLYAVLADGVIERLRQEGIRFLFVSNSDNLGAVLDPVILTWFADSQAPFLMEVTARTESDRKGGHLAMENGRFVLRESAQCPDADMDSFQDIARHRFFNTNNLWLRLDRLQDALNASGGSLPLPLIRNKKTLDPRDKNSPAVYQLETAMGAAIGCFPDATALAVPRSRFAPVKTTGDLFVLRSDAYTIGEDGSVGLASECGQVPPVVNLDSNYKLVDQLEDALRDGVPSLKQCQSLSLQGPFTFMQETRFVGKVGFKNNSTRPVALPSGTYENEEREF